MIIVNSVFKYLDGERVRIIDIFEQYGYLVNIDSATSMPRKEHIERISEEIDAEKLITIKDPFSRIVDESALSKIQISKRDEEWNFILKYWEVNRFEILEKSSRNNALEKIASSSNLSLTKVKKVFSRYWQI
ncbi:hypothetical protein [Clostridium sartagoforme]|uniref:hypothetical protein n=1 Tax=Clostridium sartagoforme TaxID=84031 RepID=UPI0031D9B5FC